MIPRDKLEKLQHKCKGQGKENLYHLIGVHGNAARPSRTC